MNAPRCVSQALAAATSLSVVALELPATAVASAGAPPAGGAAVGQVIGVSVAAAVLTGALLVFGLGHRTGRIGVLGRAANAATRLPPLRGLPGWAALPVGLAGAALLVAVFGMYWDISLHIDNGRDPGPLANPAHYFILAGLFGLFSAGWLSMVLAEGRPGGAAVRLTRDWHVPVSAILLMACGSFALFGFPLDDVWHRLFGQDVTLWGPTHLMLIGGAGFSLIGVLGLIAEGQAVQQPVSPGAHGPRPQLGVSLACGGLLIGMSVFQGEFDFGVEQFRLLFDPVLIALAATLALVCTRVIGGRGSALRAAAFFVVVRGLLALLVGVTLGQITPHLPLYLIEALLVEGVALLVGTARPYRFGLGAGALIGTVGVLGEWGWSHAWMPIAWPAHVLPGAVALALPVALGAGLIGAFAGGALRLRADVAAQPRAWAAAVGSLAVIALVVGYLAHTTAPAGTRAAVTLSTVVPAPHRAVRATVAFVPPALARGADWLTVTAWQGHSRAMVAPLRRGADGLYRSTAPIPVWGTWKAMVRLHRGQTLATVPIYLPADSAIPVAGVPASERFVRGLQPDRSVLQRERRHGVPSWLWTTAGAVVLMLFLALLALIGWGLARLAAQGEPRPRAGRSTQASRVRAPAHVGRLEAG